MEHISQDLVKFPLTIQDQKNFCSDGATEPGEGSPEWIMERLRRFNVSSLSHTFEALKRDTQNKEAIETLRAISEGQLKKQFVLIYGMTGCGKTHLIEATILNWAKHGLRSRYLTFSDIARSLKAALRQGGEFYELQFNAYRDMKRLIVDDFGSGTTESRFEIADLEDIIDQRYRRRYYSDCDLVTILATNKDIKDLPDRIVSRFFDPEFGTVLYMGDRDYRRRKEK